MNRGGRCSRELQKQSALAPTAPAPCWWDCRSFCAVAFGGHECGPLWVKDQSGRRDVMPRLLFLTEETESLSKSQLALMVVLA